MQFSLTYEMRNPPWTGRSFDAFYAQVLDQIAWADARGFDAVGMAEHHGDEDGYIPSPLVLAAAMGARTRRIRLSSLVVKLPLHHPVDIAEQAAIVDIVSGGRLDGLVFREGTRHELEAYGVPFDERGDILAEAVQIVRKCWEQDDFSFQGKYWQLRNVRVLPKPVHRLRIAMTDYSEQAARTAARFADSFQSSNPGWMQYYHDELRKMGKNPGPVPKERPRTGFFTHVTRDTERDWARLRRHALHDWTAYSRFNAEHNPFFRPIDDQEELRNTGIYEVLTPAQTVAILKERQAELGSQAGLRLRPAMGGMPVEMGQECLELVVKEVMPAFQSLAPAPGSRP